MGAKIKRWFSEPSLGGRGQKKQEKEQRAGAKKQKVEKGQGAKNKL